MAEVFRPAYTRTDPKTGKKVKVQSRTWHARYYTPSGERIRVKGYRDKKATEAMAAELERRAARLAAGLADPMDEHAKKPLTEHLGDFIAYLQAKGNTAKHVALSETRIQATLARCRFVRVADVQPSAVMGFLAELRAAGRGVKTANE